MAGSVVDILQDNLRTTAAGGVIDIEACVQDAVELVDHILLAVTLDKEEEEEGRDEEKLRGMAGNTMTPETTSEHENFLGEHTPYHPSGA